MLEEFKVGERVWYLPSNDADRQQAEIVTLDGFTQVTIRLQSGPDVGELRDVPLADMIQKIKK